MGLISFADALGRILTLPVAVSNHRPTYNGTPPLVTGPIPY